MMIISISSSASQRPSSFSHPWPDRRRTFPSFPPSSACGRRRRPHFCTIQTLRDGCTKLIFGRNEEIRKGNRVITIFVQCRLRTSHEFLSLSLSLFLFPASYKSWIKGWIMIFPCKTKDWLTPLLSFFPLFRGWRITKERKMLIFPWKTRLNYTWLYNKIGCWFSVFLQLKSRCGERERGRKWEREREREREVL